MRQNRALRRRYGHLFGARKPFVPTRGGEQSYVGKYRILLSHGGEYLIYGPDGGYRTTVDTWPQATGYVDRQVGR